MKTIYSIFTFVMALLISACTNDKGALAKDVSLKYDFAKPGSQSEMDSLLVKIGRENQEVDIDKESFFGLDEIEIGGMHYDGVPIKKVLKSDSYTLLTTDTIHHYGKKLLEAIEAKNGLINQKDSYSDDEIEFIWDSETKDLEFKLHLVNGKHLAAIGDKDYAELNITYKPVYEVPLANIHKRLTVYENQPQYVVQIDGSHWYKIIINDINIADKSKEREHALNSFIIEEKPSSLKIIAKPRGKQKFDKYDSFGATIYDSTTKEIIARVEPQSVAGKSSAELGLDFTPTLPWYPKAWNDGVDLRKDKNLKQKIGVLYKKIGEAILSKDEKAINDLFYQRQFEEQQANQDIRYETARFYWGTLLEIQKNSYKYTVEDDYSIEYNSGGRLIWTYSNKKTDMMIFTGKKFSDRMNFYLYQPKGSNELKIIR